jgi:intracellular multiplication protein IcmL
MAESELHASASKLAKTSDALDPAVRQHEERQERASLKSGYVRLALLLGASNVLLVMGLLVALWFAVHPTREYFASDNGRIIPLVPQSQPYRTAADVIDFAKRTVEHSFTLDFLSYQANLEAVRGNYTRPGFKSFLDNLVSSQILNMVRNQRMNLTVSTGTGIIAKEGEVDGTYVWEVRMPVALKLAGQTTQMPEQKMMATIEVRRIPTLDSIEGIAVANIVTTPQ